MRKHTMSLALIVLLVLAGVLVTAGAAAPVIKMLKTPKLISPRDGSVFDYYPRTLTLEWGEVKGAVRYQVDREALIDGEWKPYLPIETTNTRFTFDFVGAQPGRWRVTAVGPDPLRNSFPSRWNTFTFIQ